MGKIIIVGKGGSGKDYIRKKFQDKGFKFAIPYTSRPIRNNEKNGVDYYYVTREYFSNNSSEFYEIHEFNGWLYGHKIKDFENGELFIMTPKGIKKLKEDDRKKSVIIYLDLDRNILQERLNIRGDADSVKRRLDSDDLDFSEFHDFDIRITDPFF